jgi:hypothetical protein
MGMSLFLFDFWIVVFLSRGTGIFCGHVSVVDMINLLVLGRPFTGPDVQQGPNSILTDINNVYEILPRTLAAWILKSVLCTSA